MGELTRQEPEWGGPDAVRWDQKRVAVGCCNPKFAGARLASELTVETLRAARGKKREREENGEWGLQAAGNKGRTDGPEEAEKEGRQRRSGGVGLCCCLHARTGAQCVVKRGGRGKKKSSDIR